jgi:D-proline reductase (dithiol) PrdB
VGLVARRIEAAGIPTVTLNMIWVYHRIVGMPRVAAIEHPFGRPFGDVGDAGTQRAVLLAALRVFEHAREPGHVEHLPFVWHEPPDATKGTAGALPIIALLRTGAAAPRPETAARALRFEGIICRWTSIASAFRYDWPRAAGGAGARVLTTTRTKRPSRGGRACARSTRCSPTASVRRGTRRATARALPADFRDGAFTVFRQLRAGMPPPLRSGRFRRPRATTRWAALDELAPMPHWYSRRSASNPSGKGRA